ncbi:hypothetical protein B0H16DRAFT_1466238 [Mycena metata]|uniref:Uncharacterized protein n=1 Tax=Mycena metata TaxID=1033252 RepID=A0AAD7MXG9_9AGAR|nr:hypothetical protein B0H16DRAFT_1466238 [Mycena metata]
MLKRSGTDNETLQFSAKSLSWPSCPRATSSAALSSSLSRSLVLPISGSEAAASASASMNASASATGSAAEVEAVEGEVETEATEAPNTSRTNARPPTAPPLRPPSIWDRHLTRMQHGRTDAYDAILRDGSGDCSTGRQTRNEAHPQPGAQGAPAPQAALAVAAPNPVPNTAPTAAASNPANATAAPNPALGATANPAPVAAAPNPACGATLNLAPGATALSLPPEPPLPGPHSAPLPTPRPAPLLTPRLAQLPTSCPAPPPPPTLQAQRSIPSTFHYHLTHGNFIVANTTAHGNPSALYCTPMPAGGWHQVTGATKEDIKCPAAESGTLELWDHEAVHGLGIYAHKDGGSSDPEDAQLLARFLKEFLNLGAMGLTPRVGCVVAEQDPSNTLFFINNLPQHLLAGLLTQYCIAAEGHSFGFSPRTPPTAQGRQDAQADIRKALAKDQNFLGKLLRRRDGLPPHVPADEAREALLDSIQPPRACCWKWPEARGLEDVHAPLDRRQERPQRNLRGVRERQVRHAWVGGKRVQPQLVLPRWQGPSAVDITARFANSSRARRQGNRRGGATHRGDCRGNRGGGGQASTRGP